jgi:hypothetical protein
MRPFVLVLVLAACTKKDDPPPAPTPSTTASASAKTPADVVWDPPPKWAPIQNTSAIRKATYLVPKIESDPGDTLCTVTKAGGTVDANVDRWRGMFRDPTFKRSAMTVSGIQVTVVELRGEQPDTMALGAEGGVKGRQEMLAAIIETAPELTFFKMLGPERTVEAAKTEFLHLVESIRPK